MTISWVNADGKEGIAENSYEYAMQQADQGRLEHSFNQFSEGQQRNFETKLTPDEETQFQGWKQQHAPNDSGFDYDLRGAFLRGFTPSLENGHWPDTFKKPNHETFSDESVYAKDRPDLAGKWIGPKHDVYLPPDIPAYDVDDKDRLPGKHEDQNQPSDWGMSDAIDSQGSATQEEELETGEHIQKGFHLLPGEALPVKAPKVIGQEGIEMSYDKFVNYLHDLNVRMNGGKEVKDWTVREHIGDFLDKAMAVLGGGARFPKVGGLRVALKDSAGNLTIGEPGKLHADLGTPERPVKADDRLGFVTPEGEYLTRKQALDYAKNEGLNPNSEEYLHGIEYNLAKKTERIAKPAIQTAEGKVFEGDNHFTAHTAAGEPENFTEGYTTNLGRYVSRQEGAKIANAQDQLVQKGTEELHSGDLKPGYERVPVERGWPQERVDRATKMIAEGKSFAEVGKELGITYQSVSSKMKQLGIESPYTLAQRDKPPKEPLSRENFKWDAFRIDEYKEFKANGWTNEEIADKWGVSTRRLKDQMRAFGVSDNPYLSEAETEKFKQLASSGMSNKLLALEFDIHSSTVSKIAQRLGVEVKPIDTSYLANPKFRTRWDAAIAKGLKTRPELAEELGISFKTVDSIGEKLGMEFKSHPNSPWTPKLTTQLEKGLKEGKTYSALAEELGVSRNTIAGKVSRLK